MNVHLTGKALGAPLPPVLKAKQVAELLNYRAVETFYAKRPQLEKLGFPAKLPGINGWSRRAVLRWIDPDEAAAAPAAPLRENALEERYA